LLRLFLDLRLERVFGVTSGSAYVTERLGCSTRRGGERAAAPSRLLPPLDLPRRCGLLRFTDGAGDAVFAEAGDDAVEGRVQADAGGAARVGEERQLRLGGARWWRAGGGRPG